MSYTGFVQGSETTLQSTYSDTSAQPTCDYGYGTWNSGTNRGYEGYGYGYGYGQDNTTNYGINQRLDMVPHLETDMMQGGVYGSGGERYDSYESCDSRAVLSERDLYRSGYDYSELDPEMEMAYEGQYDAYRDQFRMRGNDTFGPRAQGWARDARSGRPMASGYGRMWEDPMGARGQCMSGASRLPSLFSQNIIPEYGMFQGMRGGGAFPGGSRFGFGFGNGMKQMRRTWKTWTTADFRTKKKKRKQGGSPDEPDSKATRTDCSDNSDSDNDEGTEGEATEGLEGTEAVEKGSRVDGEDEEGKEDGREEGKEDSEKGALTTQDENGQTKRKLQAGKKSQDKQKKRQRDRMVERIQFVCSLCKYRTFYEDEMASHLDSKFHKEHFKYVGTKLPKQTADFLQEYVTNKTKKTEELRKTVEDLDGLIQQIYRDQDLTQEIAMEHFVKKVEAAHCAACDLFIPMQFGIIQKHLKTMDHNRNRRLMMEQSKKSSLMVARSILNNKLISKKLERYLKGENPFTDSPEEEAEGGALDEGAQGEAAGVSEGAEGAPAQPPVPPEPAPGAVSPPPPPPPEEEEEGAVPLLGGALQRQIRGIPGLDVEDDEEGGGGVP
ncbi:A-kinase anchor protein 8-like isoform X2 [Macaca nemestrina]|uniref:A-kinase anchoring protein 8 like n=1 Tax=Macaca mulatta TaxID=9544 RepID=F7DN43_MACMU|nr:A-kinase anchor protein 8-like isoform X2 [Macaca fascicularis]XP_011763497.1 A-kinase anchor protein 8-like isoform X2 [Macaca nemestrina]XP_014978657.1 A-kinase anchor protein 8-like isoform X1 [Macaca mulatta]